MDLTQLWQSTECKNIGSAIVIAPNAITLNTLSALQTIHAKDSNVFKGDEFYGLLDGGAEGGRSVQMTANNEAHAARRRVLNRALPAREQVFRNLDQLARRFADIAGSHSRTPMGAEKGSKVETTPIDINNVSSWFSFDLISTVAFGKSLDMLQNAEYRWVPDCLISTSIFLYWAGYAPFVWFWRWFLGSNLPSLLRMQAAIDAQIYGKFAGEMMASRAKRMQVEDDTDSKSSDIFQHLINTKLYNQYDLRADSSLLIAAGSDAVRLTIAATIFYWLKDPPIFEKAVDEIRSCVTSSEHITDSTLSSLRYLRACVDETMRLCPPKASSLPREVLKGGITIDGIHVPEGMTVGTSTYALHHDPDIYPDPFAYNPDRWLQQPQDRRMAAAFCPFLKGPRMCPGQTVAYFAMELALFHLVYRYDIRGTVQRVDQEGLLDGRKRDDEYHFKDWILGYADGPFVELVERVS
ncbi:MAG: hypothetical protein Q9218_003230 [Villophora microphyllina]